MKRLEMPEIFNDDVRESLEDYDFTSGQENSFQKKQIKASQ